MTSMNISIRDILLTGTKFFSVIGGGLWRGLTLGVVVTFLTERGVVFTGFSGWLILISGLVWILEPMLKEVNDYIRRKEVDDVIRTTTKQQKK